MTVAPRRIQIEEIHKLHLPRAKFQPPLPKFRIQREWVRFRCDGRRRERNYGMNHGSADIRRRAKRRIVNHIQIGKSSQSKSVSNSAPARALKLAEHLDVICQLDSG